MADASDSKSDGGNLVPVQVRPPALIRRLNCDSINSLSAFSLFITYDNIKLAKSASYCFI